MNLPVKGSLSIYISIETTYIFLFKYLIYEKTDYFKIAQYGKQESGVSYQKCTEEWTHPCGEPVKLQL